LKTRQVSEFKETEFGKVPVDWEVTELENICERVSVGHVGLTSKFFCGKEEGVLFLRSQNVRPGRINLTDLKYVTYNFHETHKKSQLHEGDLMIVRVGSNRGDCCVVPKGFDKLNCANIVFARPKSEFSSFLGHYFRSHLGKQKLDSISTGSAQGVINTKHIAKLLIPLPLPHQALAISHLLDTLDFKIQNLQNQNKTLEQIAQAIFKSWFVDFDGVTEWDDSELGKIPKGWSVNILDSIANNVRNTIKSKDITPDIFYIGLEHMPRDNVGLDTWENSNKLKSNKFKFETNQILFGKLRPYFKKVGISPINGICSTDILVLNSKDTSWLEFLLFTVSSYDFIEYASQSTTGTKMPRTDWDYMKKYKIIFPPLTKVLKFHVIIKKLIEMMRKNIFEIKTLTKTRDILLPKLMSGEIRV